MKKMSSSERIDDLGIKGYKLIQIKEGFCFGIDAVLLSDFAYTKKGGRCLDLCSGTGIIPILMEAKEKCSDFVTIEIQEDYADLIKRNVALNGIESKFKIIQGDLKEYKKYFKPNEFDAVTCNPPYMKANSGLINEDAKKNIARHEIECNIEDVIKCSAYTLKEKGHLFLIHRAYRIVDIIYTLRKYKIEPKDIRFVHSNEDSEATLVLIDAMKGGNASCNIKKPLIIYEKPDVYTKEVLDIYGITN